ncbi:MAG: ATP-grasp fold amidoligase family protein [Anaerolineaceae bacterium]|nr:ATP-grasp fold amidoligase family protein [Anaerolineaceae bacterium]
MHALRAPRGNRSCDGQKYPAQLLLRTYFLDQLVYKFMRAVLPENPRGDTIYAWFHFLATHRRLPGSRESGLLNDLLYHVRVDGDLLDPLGQFVSDKEYAKLYVGATVGERYTLKTLALLNRVEEVDRLRLTHFPCVVKPTHLSGEVQFFGEDDGNLDRERMKRWFGANLYRESREQNYRWLRPRIMVEEYFDTSGAPVPDDYKIFCFRGEPRFIQVDSGRFTSHTRNIYDTSWRRLPCSIHYPARVEDDARPEPLARMLEIASRLAAPFDFIRVDFYVKGDDIRVGELTNCPEGAFGRLLPAGCDERLGNLLLAGGGARRV